ncbi:MAG TPA: hypothetical protein VHQ90_00550 [Thermoanaerobaculia bacterium]|nr:hypothetical protein [Thermoanaerobaculia bacterium]
MNDHPDLLQPTWQEDAAPAFPELGVSTHPEQLIEVWLSYFRKGDGHFNSEGLRRHLQAAGITAEVVVDEQLGDSVLGVEFDDGLVYLLPHFNRTPQAVAEWFHQTGSSSRLARIQRLVRAAVANRTPGGHFELQTKGAVE